MLEMGTIEQNIIRQSEQARLPIPEKILNSPELLAGLELYLNAFFDLDSERSHGTSLSPIPLSSVLEYARFFDFDECQTENLVFFIRQMDNVHLKRLDNKMKQQIKKK